MKHRLHPIVSLTALLCAAAFWSGCAGAADKDKSQTKQDDAIRWEAPAASGSASAAAPTVYSSYATNDDLHSVWEEMNRMHQSMLGSFGGWGVGGFDRPLRSSLYSMSGASEMHADVAETDREYVITCELPGVPKQNIQIDVDGNALVVRALRDAGTDRSGEEGGQKYHYRERSYGTTERRFRIGSGVDPKKIKAHLKDGILTLRVPKGESRSVQIPIEG